MTKLPEKPPSRDGAEIFHRIMYKQDISRATLPPADSADPSGDKGKEQPATPTTPDQNISLAPGSEDVTSSIEIVHGEPVTLSDEQIKLLNLPPVKTRTLVPYVNSRTNEHGYIIQTPHATLLYPENHPGIEILQMGVASVLEDAVLAGKPIYTADAIKTALKESGFKLDVNMGPIEIIDFGTRAMEAMTRLKMAAVKSESVDLFLKQLAVIRENIGKGWFESQMLPPQTKMALTYLADMTIVYMGQQMGIENAQGKAKDLADMEVEFSKTYANIAKMWIDTATDTLRENTGKVGEAVKDLMIKVVQGGGGATKELLRLVTDSMMGTGAYDEGMIRSLLGHVGVGDDALVELAKKVGSTPAAILRGFWDTISAEKDKKNPAAANKPGSTTVRTPARPTPTDFRYPFDPPTYDPKNK